MATLDAQIASGQAIPAHVMRFGAQVHAAAIDRDNVDELDDLVGSDGQDLTVIPDRDGFAGVRGSGITGIEAGTVKAEKAIGCITKYITKYITKSVDECHTRTSPREIEHHRRFHEALRFTPCSERCANWLRYGIQPKHAKPEMVAGRCKGRVHQPSTLGIKGRRILVSRDWSGKTLADHKHDQARWVRRILAFGLGHLVDTDTTIDAGHELQPDPASNLPDVTDSSATTNGDDQDEADDQGDEHDQAGGVGVPVGWERVRPGDPDARPLHLRLWHNVGQRIRQRNQWRAALEFGDATGPPPHNASSATPALAGAP